MYLFISKYVKPLEEVDRVLPKHVAYLDENYANGNFIFSGRQIPRVGGVILCKADTKTDAEAILALDPFAIEGVAAYEVIEFDPTKYAEAFEPCIHG